MTSRMISGRSSRRREIYPEEGGVMFHKASLQGVPSEHLPAAHALRRPLPGIPHSLRLDDAGDAKPAWITLLTTEHYNLQMQRVATISESNGRASVFLGAVSAGLIALGFESTRGASPIGHMIFQVLVLTPLVFLGLVAFMRCLEIAIDDWEFITRITRLRRTYDQLIPELAPLMSLAVADEGTAAMLSPRWQPFQKMLSVAGSVAVITSVVLGGDAGVIVFGVSRMLYLAIALGTAAGALALGWATWYQWRHWCQASGPPSRDITPGRAAHNDQRPLVSALPGHRQRQIRFASSMWRGPGRADRERTGPDRRRGKRHRHASCYVPSSRRLLATGVSRRCGGQAAAGSRGTPAGRSDASRCGRRRPRPAARGCRDE